MWSRPLLPYHWTPSSSTAPSTTPAPPAAVAGAEARDVGSQTTDGPPGNDDEPAIELKRKGARKRKGSRTDVERGAFADAYRQFTKRRGHAHPPPQPLHLAQPPHHAFGHAYHHPPHLHHHAQPVKDWDRPPPYLTDDIAQQQLIIPPSLGGPPREPRPSPAASTPDRVLAGELRLLNDPHRPPPHHVDYTQSAYAPYHVDYAPPAYGHYQSGYAPYAYAQQHHAYAPYAWAHAPPDETRQRKAAEWEETRQRKAAEKEETRQRKAAEWEETRQREAAEKEEEMVRRRSGRDARINAFREFRDKEANALTSSTSRAEINAVMSRIVSAVVSRREPESDAKGVESPKIDWGEKFMRYLSSQEAKCEEMRSRLVAVRESLGDPEATKMAKTTLGQRDKIISGVLRGENRETRSLGEAEEFVAFCFKFSGYYDCNCCCKARAAEVMDQAVEKLKQEEKEEIFVLSYNLFSSDH